MVLLATRYSKGNRRIGPVPLDCEVNAQHTKSATFSERRIADGSQASDHSQNEPDELVLSGIVDSINPLSEPDAGVRDRFAAGEQRIGDSLQTLSDNVTGQRNMQTGLFMQYERLADLVRSRDEIEIVCARGVFMVTARSFTVQDNSSTGTSSQFTLTCRQMLRGKAKVITVPTDLSQELVGSGQTKALGSTSTTDVTI